MLGPDELKRRIDAARTVNGMSQNELAARLHEDGFGKQDAGRLERGDLPLTPARRRSLAGILGVPETWFVEPDFADVLQPGGAEDMQGLVSEIKQRLDGMEATRASAFRDLFNRVRAIERQTADLTGVQGQLAAIEQHLAAADKSIRGQLAKQDKILDHIKDVLEGAEVVSSQGEEQAWEHPPVTEGLPSLQADEPDSSKTDGRDEPGQGQRRQTP